MLGSANLIGFVPSGDLERSRAFYVELLGLHLVEVTPFACVLSAGSTMLRVTKVEALRPQPFTVLGWRVDDVHRAVADLAARGVECIRFDGLDQDHAAVWTAPDGTRIAWFRDPDGNVLSLTELGS